MARVEYAITAGEGVLLAYGVTDKYNLVYVDAGSDDPEDVGGAYIGWEDYGGLDWCARYPNATLIARPCSDDCETGK